MWLMLQQDKPDDYVIATGEMHSVAEFVQEAFASVGLNWKEYVKTDQRLKRPLDVYQLCGNPTKAAKKLGWKPQVTFKELVKIMVEADLERWKQHLDGKSFSWDAPNYPPEMDIISRNVVRDVQKSVSRKSKWKRILKL